MNIQLFQIRSSIPYLFYILIITKLTLILKADCRRCYSCSTFNDDERVDCLNTHHLHLENKTIEVEDDEFNDDVNVSIIFCPSSFYCTIKRQEYADVPGGVNYLNRSCEESKLNSVVASGYFITYERSCRSDLCNYPNGVESLEEMPEDAEDEFPPPSQFDSSSSAAYPFYFSIILKIYHAFLILLLLYLLLP